MCKGAQDEFIGVWDPAIKHSVKKAFLNTKASFAQGTWERVESAVENYLSQWIQMRSDVCEARLACNQLGNQSARCI